MSRKILVVGGPEVGRVYPLTDGSTLSIGRGQQSDTKINDPYLSRLHCTISLNGDVATLSNTGSGNTLFNGTPIEQRVLTAGDEFQAGSSTFRYTTGEVDSETTLRVPAPEKTPAKLTTSSETAETVERALPLKQLVGKSLSQFRLEKIIAAGASGYLFKATDTEKQRIAAVKVLSPDRTSTEEERERFVRAMKTMLPIKHPNIVPLWNAGKNGPFCWAAMEFIDCESMTELINRIGIDKMLDWREVWRVAVHIGRALEKAYQEKVVHRNVTPANILRRKSDKVCLLGDLMLAKALEGTLAKQVTSPGQIVGELPFLPPERTRDDGAVDTRSDMYGLGATLYALMAGRPPFQAESTTQLVRKIREEVPESPRNFQMSINEPFEGVVLKMLAKIPDQRYATPTDLLNELEKVGKSAGLKID